MGTGGRGFECDGEREMRASAFGAFDGDGAAHERDDAFADRQSETGAAEAARGGGVDLGERDEEAGFGGGGDAYACVADGAGQVKRSV